jgi:glyoxylase-like metal-dependent hydrolase (beta-lactamase superfamily II)
MDPVAPDAPKSARLPVLTKGDAMRARHGLLLATLLIGLGVTAVSRAQSPAPPVREITKIAGEVYRFRNASHYSVFAVTPAGVIATDPINADAARWLRAEITRRFNQPVRYLVYSHDHADHISGGEVFADTAVVVAHDNAKPVIVGERRPTAVPQVTFGDRMTIDLGGTLAVPRREEPLRQLHRDALPARAAALRGGFHSGELVRLP